jgi:hypothetical protein
MTEVYRQVNTVSSLNGEEVALFFYEDCHELVADFRGVLSSV